VTTFRNQWNCEGNLVVYEKPANIITFSEKIKVFSNKAQEFLRTKITVYITRSLSSYGLAFLFHVGLGMSLKADLSQQNIDTQGVLGLITLF